ncbi:glycosyltransferase family 2 protein [Agrobacterium vitis]|uniref:glycosyltransferase family 2 protein n=1 Tax=Agrobacterium vitis TaxID=373 RepID=UPI0015D99D0E|nr:glycosyltransferase family 2 protein [Agrobacterium vitis]MCF1455490.1 glycosyltransferase family 2 protein [Agrobacterium vitis]BCH57189.1 succinoglycan biosynthesis protein ExoW [Agrobacterium vitis]
MSNFTVIIPFYQKNDGILRRGLSSVFAQSYQNFEIVIVDDASPHPIMEELAPLSQSQRDRIRVIHQKNSGPGGARNTGLTHIGDNSQYIAFLDSDDTWHEDHLKNAIATMQRFEADCYWASISGGEGFEFHFSIHGLEQSEKVQRLQDTPLVLEVPDMAGLMFKQGEFLYLSQFLHLSTMVIGRSLAAKVQFEAHLRLAAEDVLFFSDCVLAAKRVALCGADGAQRGEGMNIFHSIDASSPVYLKQQFDMCLAQNILVEKFAKRSALLTAIRDSKETVRRHALWSQVGRIKRGQMPQLGLLAQWVVKDPKLLLTLVSLAVSKLRPSRSTEAVRASDQTSPIQEQL